MDIATARTSATEMINSVPKVIDPATHAVLDYLTAATFFSVGLGLWTRHRRAARLALIQGTAVLGASMLTDYPGGVFKKISFRTHGMLDVAHAAMTATMPALMGFAGDPEAQFFHGQALIEAGVIAATDFGA